jgi:uncharacterized protein YbaP (TraB family)
LGSLHVATRDLYPLDPRIEAAFDRAGTLVLETAMDPAAQQQAALKLASTGTYPAGDSIDKHVDGEILELLDRRLRRGGVPPERIRPLRPWYLAVMLTLGELQKLGYDPNLGIDRYFAEKARNRKRILALETIDEQVALFGGMPESVQASMLKQTLMTLDELGEEIRKAILHWHAGDATAMDALLVAPIRKDYPDVYQRLFVHRNRRMATAIEGYLKGNGMYFVVVGSGHLLGTESILDLLRARGYAPVQQ